MKMSEPIAVTRDAREGNDFTELYKSLIFKRTRKRIIIDLIFIFLCAVFAVCSVIVFFVNREISIYSVAFAVVVGMSILWHFIRRPLIVARMAKNAEKRYAKIGDPEDTTEFFEDRLIVHRAMGNVEMLYSHISSSSETENLFVIISDNSSMHYIKKNSFIKGSLEDIRTYLP